MQSEFREDVSTDEEGSIFESTMTLELGNDFESVQTNLEDEQTITNPKIKNCVQEFQKFDKWKYHKNNKKTFFEEIEEDEKTKKGNKKVKH